MTTQQRKTALRRQMADYPSPDWTPLIERFLALPQLEKVQTVMLFYGVGREPDTTQIITQLLCSGKTVVLPRCLPQRRMEARAVTGLHDLIMGAFGILEPNLDCPVVERDTIELILVPNLCCDRSGYRLGHGAGYYDRYLDGYSGFTVSLCPEEWLQEELPRDEFDRPVDLVLF